MNSKLKWALLKRPRSHVQGMGLSTGRQRHYEEATGQVFDERIVPIQTASDHRWTRQEVVATDPKCAEHHSQYLEDCNRFQHEQVPGVKPAKGARPLTEVVIEFLVQNLADISLEALECLPLQVVRRLWVEASFRFPISFETWHMFSRILGKEHTTNLTLLRYRHQIKKPLSPLDVYAAPLTSTSFEFITSLSITTGFSIPDLVNLSKMTNIGILEIIGPTDPMHDDTSSRPFPAVNDTLVRAWSRAASESEAFPVLRILRMCNHQGLTNQSVTYLNGFKSLAIYDVSGTAVEAVSAIEAQKLGWKYSALPDTLDLLAAACAERDKIFQARFEEEKVVQKPRRRRQRELFDGSTVKRIPRSEISKLLAKRATSLPQPKCDDKGSLNALGDKEALTAVHNEGEEPAKIKHKQKEPQQSKRWDFSNLACFSRIGELRNDKDLTAAGIEIGDQPVVDNELVPPIPIVSLRLGQNNVQLAHQSPLCTMVFTRIKVPEEGQAGAGDKPTKSGNDKITNKKRDHARAAKKFGLVRNGKKQKLENVLDSFLM